MIMMVRLKDVTLSPPRRQDAKNEESLHSPLRLRIFAVAWLGSYRKPPHELPVLVPA
jgi:hypothetical protein